MPGRAQCCPVPCDPLTCGRAVVVLAYLRILRGFEPPRGEQRLATGPCNTVKSHALHRRRPHARGRLLPHSCGGTVECNPLSSDRKQWQWKLCWPNLEGFVLA